MKIKNTPWKISKKRIKDCVYFYITDCSDNLVFKVMALQKESIASHNKILNQLVKLVNKQNED